MQTCIQKPKSTDISLHLNGREGRGVMSHKRRVYKKTCCCAENKKCLCYSFHLDDLDDSVKKSIY